MADITISELELTDNILDDMTIPVETPSKTFSATLKQLKNYIGGDLPLGSIIPNVGVLNDERFTLLDGKTLASNGTYAEFYRKAVENIANGYWVQCTEEEFNSDVSNYGSCGKFVVTDEYIRIPKITKFIGATNILSEIGKTYKESLPNIKGRIDPISSGRGSAGFVSQSGSLIGETNDKTAGLGGNGVYKATLGFDASRSSSTYQDGAKVQPDHTKYPYYMKISTEGQKEPIEIDINNVYEDLELKANKSLSNLTAEGKSLASGLGMPSNNYIDLTLGANNSTYTAPANGRLSLTKQQGDSTYNYNIIAINGLQYKSVTGGASGSTSTIVAPMKKGDVATILYTTTGKVEQFRFTYAEGEN